MNSFSSSWDMIGFNLAKMREESYLCDFKIAASDFEKTRTLIFAHSVVMAASCSKFYNSLVTDHTKLKSAQTFVTSEVTTKALSIAVDFIYGKLPTKDKDIEALGKAANILGIPTAKKYVKSFEKKNRKVSKTSKLTKDIPKLTDNKGILTVKLFNSFDERKMKEMMRTTSNLSDIKSLESKIIYSCPICDMIYEEQLELINHLNTCHRLKQCPLCFTELQDSTSHLLKEHQVIKSLCYTQHDPDEDDAIVSSIGTNTNDDPKRKVIFCSNSFEDMETATRHCKHCDEEVSDITYLHEHLVRNHHYVKCTHCHSTVLYSRFLKHLKDLHRNSYTCCKCNANYDKPIMLLEHINEKHTDKEIYFCSVCAFNTPGILSIIEHFVECHEILAQYSYLKGLNLVLTKFNIERVPPLFDAVTGNQRSMDLKENWLQSIYLCCCCSSCHYTIFELCVCIQNHLHNNYPLYEEEKPYNCWKCDRAFSDLLGYERHLYYHEKKQTKHMCDICGYGTNSLTTAEVHANSHAGIKPFSCDFCDRIFSLKTGLESHIKSQHTEDTTERLICQICGKKFKYTTSLNVHIKRTHDTSYNPSFSCDQCSYQTHTRQRMESHMRFHGANSKEKMCSLCGKASLSMNTLRKHMKKVHNINYTTRATLSNKQYITEIN